MNSRGTSDPLIDGDRSPLRRTPRVLVVDDDPKFLARVHSWLGNCDLNLICAETSPSAVHAAQTLHIDLALVDFRLRGRENGLTLAHLLQADHGIPFIIVSQYLDTTLTVQAMKLGAENVLDKPTTAAPLLNAIYEALSKGSLGADSDEKALVALKKVETADGSYGSDESAAARLAVVLLRGCSAQKDPRTNSRLVRVAGVSEAVFREVCHQCSVKPRAARDLARLLRAIRLSFAEGSTLASHIWAGDGRTVDRLLVRAGLTPGCRGIDLRTLFQTQRLIPGHLEVLSELAHLAANSSLFQGDNSGQ